MATVAFLGTGAMGAGMARSLRRAGHAVVAWHRDAAKARALAADGVTVAPSPAAAARGVEAAFAMVADDEASSRVWLAPDGALAALPAGAFAIECSTVSHGHVAALAAAAASRGLRYLDCPVNGGPSVAAQGGLTLLVGAPEASLEAARPLLGAIGTSIIRFGEIGAGTAFKLVNNLLGAVHVASLAEAVALAARAGLDREALVRALENGPCASPHVKRLAAAMVEDRAPATPGLAIGLREKDARYALAMARGLGAGAAVGEAAYAWYAQAKPGLGGEDDARLVRLVRERGGRP
jgi:3-hydroxyisobutyrate dehydrogenase-like beta-hydroxyacid dehydrogenase